MRYSFEFVVAILYATVFVIPGYSMFNTYVRPNGSTIDQCTIRNEMYWKFIAWFYGRLTFVDIYGISVPNAHESITQWSGMFSQTITESKCFIPTSYHQFNDDYYFQFKNLNFLNQNGHYRIEL